MAELPDAQRIQSVIDALLITYLTYFSQKYFEKETSSLKFIKPFLKRIGVIKLSPRENLLEILNKTFNQFIAQIEYELSFIKTFLEDPDLVAIIVDHLVDINVDKLDEHRQAIADILDKSIMTDEPLYSLLIQRSGMTKEQIVSKLIESIKRVCFENFEYHSMLIIWKLSDVRDQVTDVKKDLESLRDYTLQKISEPKYFQNNVPQQVLPLVYVNRQDDINFITSRLRENNDVVVWGKPGVGKTSTVIEVCKDNSIDDYFNSHILWINCNKKSFEAILVDMGKFLRILPKEEELSELSQSTSLLNLKQKIVDSLSIQKIMIVLDSVNDPMLIDQFFKMKPSTSIIIVTTNNAEVVTLFGSERELKELSNSHSVDYLQRRLSNVDTKYLENLNNEFCKGLPILLHWLGNRLAKHNRIPQRLHDEIKKIHSTGEYKDTLTITLDSIFNQLSESAVSTFSKLCLLESNPNSFSLECAVAITNEGNEAIYELVDWCLLNFDKDRNRYSIDSAYGHYGRTKLAEMESEKPKVNCINFFIDLTSEITNHKKMKLEEDNIITALNIAKESSLVASFCSLLNRVAKYFLSYGRILYILPLLEHAETLHRQLGDEAGLAMTYYHLGVTHYKMDSPNAEDFFASGAKLSEKLGDYVTQSYCYLGLGNINRYRQDIDESLKFYTDGLSIAKQISHTDLIIRHTSSLAIVKYLSSDIQIAINLVEDINILISESDNPILIGLVYQLLGVCYAFPSNSLEVAPDIEKADYYYDTALEAFIWAERWLLAADILHNRANIILQYTNTKEARKTAIRDYLEAERYYKAAINSGNTSLEYHEKLAGIQVNHAELQTIIDQSNIEEIDRLMREVLQTIVHVSNPQIINTFCGVRLWQIEVLNNKQIVVEDDYQFLISYEAMKSASIMAEFYSTNTDYKLDK